VVATLQAEGQVSFHGARYSTAWQERSSIGGSRSVRSLVSFSNISDSLYRKPEAERAGKELALPRMGLNSRPVTVTGL
jgi:hypothetical protein